MPSPLRRLTLTAAALLAGAAAVLTAATAPPPAAVAAGPAAAGGCTLPSGMHGPRWAGVQRRYRLLVPAGANPSTPVYVVLHGAGGTAEAMAAVSGMDVLAGSGIVVYPQASAAGNVWQVDPGSADLDYVAWIISNLHANGCGSPGTTTVSGWSMGAMLTSRLLCTHGNLIASATMVDGALPPTAGCTVRPDTALTIIHGTADPVLPFDGSIPAWVGAIIGADHQHIAFPGLPRDEMGRRWQAAKGCPAPPTSWPARTGIVWLDLTSCGTAPTRFAAVFGGGHDWDPYGSAANPGWTRARIVETAALSGGRGRAVAAGQTVRVHAADVGGAVVAATLTVVSPGSDGWLAAWPCTAARPAVSHFSYRRGVTAAGFAVSGTDAGGNLCVYSSGYTGLRVDRAGTVPALTAAARRVWDTRVGAAAAPGSVTAVPAGRPGELLAATVTVAAPARSGYATVYPCGAGRPGTSTANFAAAANTSAAAMARTDGNGMLCIYTSAAAHLIVDVAAAGVAPEADTSPRRLADTRTGATPVLPAGAVLRVPTGLPAGSGVWLNVTATGAAAAGDTAVWSCDGPRPATAAGRALPGRVTANAAVTAVGVDGSVCVAATTSTGVVVDLAAAFPPGSGLLPSTPTLLLNTRTGVTPNR